MTVSIDHYVGRTVDMVEGNSKGYMITLEGGVEIAVHDLKPSVPKNLEGQQLHVAILGSSTGNTRLRFSKGTEVEIPATKYSIFDPQHMEEPVWPQRNTDVQEILTPPHPDERLTE